MAIGTGTPFPLKGSVFADYAKSEDYSSIKLVFEPPEGLAEEQIKEKIPQVIENLGLTDVLVENTHYVQVYNPGTDELTLTFTSLENEASKTALALLFKMVFDGSKEFNTTQKIYYDKSAEFADKFALKAIPDLSITGTGTITLRIALIAGYPEDDVSVYKNIIVNAVQQMLGVNINSTEYSWITFAYEPDTGTPSEFRMTAFINSNDRSVLMNKIYHVLTTSPYNIYKFLLTFLEELTV